MNQTTRVRAAMAIGVTVAALALVPGAYLSFKVTKLREPEVARLSSALTSVMAETICRDGSEKQGRVVNKNGVSVSARESIPFQTPGFALVEVLTTGRVQTAQPGEEFVTFAVPNTWITARKPIPECHRQ